MNLSTRYAKAFIQESKDKNLYESFLKEIFYLRNIFNTYGEVKEMLISLKISSRDKISFLQEKDFQFSDFFKQVLDFLKKKKRINILTQIVEECYRLYLQENKIVCANLLLSSSLNDLKKNNKDSWKKIEEKVYSYLKNRYQKEITFNYQLAKIKKGLIIELDKVILDFSSDSFLKELIKF